MRAFASIRTAILGAAVVLGSAGAAFAQADLSGNWAPLYHEDQPERIPGPEIGDYLGLPITEAARAKAHAWSASLLTLPEHQCKPHPAAYGYRGPSNMRIQQEVDRQTQRVQKITIYIQWMQQLREVWMDGRAHPPDYAPHTWQGFATGKWEGTTLVVTTTHMKAGWVRRNGIIYSDRSVFTDRWTRHGDTLTQISILEDPLYLTEPFVRTTNWRFAPEQRIEPYPCDTVDEIAGHQLGEVPHYLPGTNTMLNEFANRHKLQPAWTEGGAETEYPEFQKVIRAGAAARPITPRAPTPVRVATPQTGDVKVFPVQGNVYALIGGGANVAVQVGPEGVLVVDTGAAARSEALLAAIRSIAGNLPVRFIINTSADIDHTGGNPAVSSAGEQVAGGDIRNALGNTAENGAAILAHEEVQTRMSQGADARPFGAWPTETFFTAKKEIFFNGEGIQLLHVPKAHSDGDLMVYFRKSDVLVVGDLFSTEGYPVFHLDRGGSLNGVIAGLNRIIDLTIPREKQEGGTYVIPGHGRIVDEAEVVDYRDMVTILRDRVADLVKKGQSLEQVKAANVTLDYDVRWGLGGEWATDAFLDAAYRSLKQP